MATDQMRRALSLRLSMIRKLSDSSVGTRAVPFIVQETSSPAESTGPSIVPAAHVFHPPDQPPGSRPTQDEAPPARDEAGRLRPPTRQSFERVSSSDLDADADADDDSAGIGLLEQNIACFALLPAAFLDCTYLLCTKLLKCG